MKIAGIGYAVFLGLLLSFYNFVVWKGVEPQRCKVEITATATQNTISTGVTAVSILLPITIGIIGFILKDIKKEVNLLFFACVCFTVSLLAGLYNLFRIPGMVNVYNLANDKPTGLLEIIQLFSLFWGAFCLILGACKIIKSYKNS